MPVAARFFRGMSSCSSAAVPAPSGIFEQDMVDVLVAEYSLFD
jgi:hypothetical protein